jgi:hypothetical protein
MTLGPEGGGTAQALKARTDASPIVKRVRHIVIILSTGHFPVAETRLSQCVRNCS